MGTNPKDGKEEVIDPELAKAQKSMGWRIDADEPTEKKEEVPETPETPAKVEDGEDDTPPEKVTVDDKKPENKPEKVERPVTYIPMPKYLSEKKDWEKELSTKESALAEANAKIAELTNISHKPEGADKEDDIEAFMEKTGFDRETVEGLLDLAEKRIGKGEKMSPEERDAVVKATAIVKEAELEAAFNNEFKTYAEPVLLKDFPNAKPEHIELIKQHLDAIAHTAENHKYPLDFLIYNNRDAIAKIISSDETPEYPTKRTIESNRMGNGKVSTLTADDFNKGEADFSALADMDSATRSQVIKEFSPATYQKFLNHAKGANQGVEVMRNGRKVILK